jgi:hypothetical protein
MTTSKVSPPKGNELLLTTALTAVPANIPANTVIVIGGVSYTQAQLVAYLTTLLAPYLAARAAQLAFTNAVTARNNGKPTVQTFGAEFKAAIVALFGRSSPILAQFGFTPHKAKARTAGESVVTAAKGLASKKKLGTKTPKQKAQLLAPEPPAFSVGSDGKVILANGGAGTAPASAATPPAGSASNTGANGAATTTPSGN